MKKITTCILIALALAFSSSAVFADSVVAAYTCELKDGKEVEELQARNSKWLKWVRANVNENIESAVGTSIVGDQTIFLFVDTYPDLSTWAATQTALDSDAASELEDMFDDLAECSSNRLWKMSPTQ
jgi:hypothetical protein